MNFSFPFPPPAPDQSAWRRLWPLVLLAVGLNALWLLGPAPWRPITAPGARVPAPADDTPELLRLGRAEPSSAPIPGLPLTALPPPPPSVLPNGAGLMPAQPAPLPTPLLPPLPAQLPDAAAALRAGLVQPAGTALASNERDALVGLQRRQWWLTASQDGLAQALWQRAKPLPVLPDGMGKLPSDAELRAMPEGGLAWLGAGDWHGRSLVGRQAALLIWRHGGKFWLLRLPLGEPEPGGKTLTSS